MIPEREREALMRLTMCARNECGMCKFKRRDSIACFEIATDCMHILADALRADRKTEPTHDIRTNTHECVKDTHDKTEQTEKKFPRSTEKPIRITWVDEDLNALGKTEQTERSNEK